MAQAIEYLPYKSEALSSNPNTNNNKKEIAKRAGGMAQVLECLPS
jgi:hypothetical protein